MPGLITLLTDFGDDDGYVAAMKGVILERNPSATIVDITHHIPPQDIPAAAFILSAAYPYYPQGAIHVTVVDPGVGTQRHALLLRTPEALFLAPDNGVLAYVLDAYGVVATGNVQLQSPHGPPPTLPARVTPPLEAWSITRKELFRGTVSQTFHGRDIFAPVAAALSKGLSPEEVGPRVEQVEIFPLLRPHKDTKGNIFGAVLHVDRFGNLITNIQDQHIPSGEVRLHIAGRSILGLSSSYTAGGELLAIVGSSGYVEIAARNGSAAQKLGVGRGTQLMVQVN